MINIFNADMMVLLPAMTENSIDSGVMDPPYNLDTIRKRFGSINAAPTKSNDAYKRTQSGFMGKEWDNDIMADPVAWGHVLRVLKPGAHIVAFSHARTYHRMATAIEDAGFEIRDQIMWLYGSGFPKAHDLGDGWKTALKPAHEPICIARKPISEKSVKANRERWGTGGFNIDKCRVVTDDRLGGGRDSAGSSDSYWGADALTNEAQLKAKDKRALAESRGRFPANVIHDGTPDFPVTKGGGSLKGDEMSKRTNGIYGEFKAPRNAVEGLPGGSAGRFFYQAKATKAERPWHCTPCGIGGASHAPAECPSCGSKVQGHPTVKPQGLMRYLCRLVTPPGGVILDPFAGSGSTLQAARSEGFGAVGIEQDHEYYEDIKRRLEL